MKRLRFLLCGVLAFGTANLALADSLKSTNYQITEDFIGGGGLINESSTNYQVNESIGDTAVGSSSSTNYQTNLGYTTTADPALTFVVTNGNANLSNFSATTTATGTATFKVINYTSYGYNVQIIGSPPQQGSYTIPGMSSGSSTTGTEQFGINLRANTTPAVGADPVQQPDNTFGFGAAATGYNTANTFQYNSGDTVATAAKSSGETDYTIAYIVNVKTTTPAGQYTTQQQLVCTGTY